LRIELEKVLANPARLGEMGMAARQNVLERFSMRRMVDNYASVYREMANRRGD
jgi:glycosyltransferase involved in cell wall biosynthesis